MKFLIFFAAVHVMVSQLKDLLGVTVPRHKGAFKIILSLRDIVMNISHSNLNAVYVSLAGLIFMVIMNEFIKPWASKRCKFPIPSELLAVVGFTMFSYFIDLGGTYGVKEVGNIPTGLPLPEMPPLALLRLVAVDAIAVTIVSYSIVMSMALIFARKEQYEVRPNQELLAMGLSNIVGSFFSCIPLSCSLSRSLIQHQAGGKTQLASVVSAGLILIGEFPNCTILNTNNQQFFLKQFFFGLAHFLRLFHVQLLQQSSLLRSKEC